MRRASRITPICILTTNYHLAMFFNLVYVVLFLRIVLATLVPPRDFLFGELEPEHAAATATLSSAQETHQPPSILSLLSSVPDKALTSKTTPHTSATSTHDQTTSPSSTTISTGSVSSTSIQQTPRLGVPTSTHNATQPTVAPTSVLSHHREAKLVGITAVCITFAVVVTMLLGFFDTWWGWLRGLVTGKKKGDDSDIEDMRRPDWEKRTTLDWPVDGAAQYDTWNDGSQNRAGAYKVQLPSSISPSIPSLPTPTYAPWSDPHPMDPMFRGQSNRGIPPALRPYPYY